MDFCFLAKEHIQYVFKRNEKFLWDNNYIRTFQSTTIFIETMQEEMNDKFTSAILYFENKNVSVNQFDQTIINPAFTFFF